MMLSKFQEHASRFGCQSFTEEEFAHRMDAEDPLRTFRTQFHYPPMRHLPKVDLQKVGDPDGDSIYLCGNSLGLQPKGVRSYLEEQLTVWAQMGVHGHRHGPMPWAFCDEHVTADSASLVGAIEEEVAIMNGLTINLHLLLTSFYRPEGERRRILLEQRAFPSDHYAFESHARLHGLNPEEVLLCVSPRPGESCLRVEDIEKVIREEGHTISLICFSGVQFYTGQLFPIARITEIGHEFGCCVGWDLAHAVGNVELRLHEWRVDFACWCTYKYLNTGAGGIAGIFVHSDIRTEDLPKLKGWWGHRIETRFDMLNLMEESPGAAGFRVSNPPILLCCALRASLDVFNKAGGMGPIREKSVVLTSYLECLLHHYWPPNTSNGIQILTPSNVEERGAQLSLRFPFPIQKVLTELESRGVACDERKPDVMRVAPAPLYNSFHDVWRFVQVLCDVMRDTQLNS